MPLKILSGLIIIGFIVQNCTNQVNASSLSEFVNEFKFEWNITCGEYTYLIGGNLVSIEDGNNLHEIDSIMFSTKQDTKLVSISHPDLPNPITLKHIPNIFCDSNDMTIYLKPNSLELSIGKLENIYVIDGKVTIAYSPI